MIMTGRIIENALLAVNK